MKTYHYTLEERNGEQEYSYQYLIHAKDKDEALEIAEDYAKTFYDDEGVELDEDTYYFFGGEIAVTIDLLVEKSKEDFIDDIMRFRELGKNKDGWVLLK